MRTVNDPYDEKDVGRRNTWTLLWLVLALAIAGWLLASTTGLPRLPDRLPDLEVVKRTLTGSELPPVDGTLYVLSTAAWVMWAWFALSLLLQLALAALHALTRGAAWVLSLRAVTDRLTPALVRRAVKPLTIGALVLTLARSSVPDVSAAASRHPHVLVADNTDPDSPGVRKYRPDRSQDAGGREYTVEAGDTLWELSEEAYGSGEHWERILEANRGRAMPDGRRFDGRLLPGDVLRIPGAPRPGEPSVTQRFYAVRDGDTLRSIAARFLADEMRWPEIYELNKSKARLGDGRVVNDPDLIWPGLHLEIPPREPHQVSKRPGVPPTRSGEGQEAEPEAKPRTTDRGQPSGRGSSKESGSHPDRAGAATGRGETSACPTTTPTKPGTPETPQPARSSVSAFPTPYATAPVGSRPARPPRTATPEWTPVSMGQAEATAVAMPSARGESEQLSGDGIPIALAYGATGVAAAGILGAGGVLATRVLRHRRADRARTGELRDDGFMQPESPRRLAQRLHNGEFEPAVSVTEGVIAFLAEHGLEDISVLTARQGPRDVQLTLSGGVAEEARVLELTDELGEALAVDVQAYATRDRDVALRIDLSDLIEEEAKGAKAHRSLLVALGSPAPGHTLYANWRALGNVLVAGSVAGSVDVLLSSLVAALISRCRSDELQLFIVAELRRLPDGLIHLPHQVVELVEPANREGVAAMIEAVHAELLARMNTTIRERTGEELPELVLVVGELADLDVDPAMLETLGMSGPEHGVRVLAATTRVAEAGGKLSYFGTRLALRVENEEESVALVGWDEAAGLSGGGDMLLRLGGRATLRLRAFRNEPEQLAQLGQLMRDTYGPSRRGSTFAPATAAGNRMGEEDPDDVSTGEPEAVHSPHSQVEEESPGWRAALDDPACLEGATDELATPEERRPQAEPSEARVKAADGATVEIACFGAFRVSSRGKDLSMELETSGYNCALHKEWELLAFMATHNPEGISAEKVAAAVWRENNPDVVTENTLPPAASRLRALLRGQAEGLDGRVIRVERGMCRLDTTRIKCDTHRFLTLIRATGPGRQAALEEAIRLYRGDLLADSNWRWVHDPPINEALSPHERFRTAFFRAAQELAEMYLAQGRPKDAIPVHKRMLELEPPHEGAFLGLIECRRRLGQHRELELDGKWVSEKIRDYEHDPDDPEDSRDDYDMTPEARAAWEEALGELVGRQATKR